MSSVFDSVDDISEKAIKQREVIRMIHADLYDAIENLEALKESIESKEEVNIYDLDQAIYLIKAADSKIY